MAAGPSIDVSGWLEEQLAQASPDLLRSMVQTFAEALMGAEADAVCGAAYGERSDQRTNTRNGYRCREWDARAGSISLAIPKLRQGSYFPGWLLERRRRAEAALVTVVATSYLLGVSTRRMEKLAETLGITRLSKWVGGFGTEDAAKAARDEARVHARRGEYVTRSTSTVADYLAEWLDTHAATVKPKTLAGYRHDIDHYIMPRIGRIRIQALRPAVISKLYRDLAEHGGRDGRPLSATTISHIHRTLRKALADAVDVEQLLVANSAARSKRPRSTAAEPIQVWTAHQLGTLLTAAQDHRLFAFRQQRALAKPLARHQVQEEQEQRFRCSWVVVRGRVELPTFRFSGWRHGSRCSIDHDPGSARFRKLSSWSAACRPAPDVWIAERRDTHETLRADDPEQLLQLIRDDYAARAVSCAVSPFAPSQDSRPWMESDI